MPVNLGRVEKILISVKFTTKSLQLSLPISTITDRPTHQPGAYDCHCYHGYDIAHLYGREELWTRGCYLIVVLDWVINPLKAALLV